MGVEVFPEHRLLTPKASKPTLDDLQGALVDVYCQIFTEKFASGASIGAAERYLGTDLVVFISNEVKRPFLFTVDAFDGATRAGVSEVGLQLTTRYDFSAAVGALQEDAGAVGGEVGLHVTHLAQPRAARTLVMAEHLAARTETVVHELHGECTSSKVM